MTSLREVAWRWRGPMILMLLVAVMADVLLRISGDVASAYGSLLDVVLILTPLAGLVLGTTRLHQARDIIELMLAQPVNRRRVFGSVWIGGVLPLAIAMGFGLLLPFLWQGVIGQTGAGMPIALAGAAIILAVISHSGAMIIALRVDDRVRALTLALAAWLVTAVLWDGIVLVAALVFASRPIELPLLFLLALNPVDLIRVLLLLGSDAAALMGHTGALVSHTVGTMVGRAAIGGLVLVWLALPLWWAERTFARKDF